MPEPEFDLDFTSVAKDLLLRAYERSCKRGSGSIATLDLLWAITRSTSTAKLILDDLGVDFDKLDKAIEAYYFQPQGVDASSVAPLEPKPAQNDLVCDELQATVDHHFTGILDTLQEFIDANSLAVPVAPPDANPAQKPSELAIISQAGCGDSEDIQKAIDRLELRKIQLGEAIQDVCTAQDELEISKKKLSSARAMPYK